MSDKLHEALIEGLLARPVSERDHAAVNEINRLRELLRSKGYDWRTGEFLESEDGAEDSD